MPRLILASGSPRRVEMMARLTKDFEIIAPEVDETILKNESPESMVLRLAVLKAETVFKKINGMFPVLAADTIVVHNGILGKPVDEKDAAAMLSDLADSVHTVITGVAVINSANGKMVSFIEKTEVSFGPIEEAEIIDYVRSGEPMDKAGAYGIQGEGGRFITGINGCFYNVMGFPMNKIYTNLKEQGII